MNPTDGHRPEATQHEIDLLVDGELDECGSPELLERLDRQSDGWQRCLSAFLEAAGVENRVPVVVTARPRSRCRQVPDLAATPLALSPPPCLAAAASFVVALGLGLLGRGFWTGARAWHAPGRGEPGSEHRWR